MPDGQQRLRFRTFLLSPPRSTDGLGNRSEPNVQEYAAINMFTVSKIAQKSSNKCPKSDPKSLPKNYKKNAKLGSENGIQNVTRWRGRASFFFGQGFQKNSWSTQRCLRMASNSPRQPSRLPKIADTSPRLAQVGPKRFARWGKLCQDGSRLLQDSSKHGAKKP